MKFQKENFNFSMNLNIRWNDMDALNHVNNVYYIDYFQNARGLYMSTASKNWNWSKDMFVIARIECDYFKELSLRSKKPMIHVRTSQIGTKSFEIEYVITSLGKDEIEIVHSKGKSVQVMIDVSEKKSIEIPEWLKTDLIQFEPSLK